MERVPVLGLAGFAGAGKDALASILVDTYGWRRVAFADPLRRPLAHLDPIFDPEAGLTPALGMVLDERLERPEPDERDVGHLVSLKGMSMNEAARFLGWRLPDRQGTQARSRPESGAWDRKRVSRVLERATGRLRGWLEGTPWVDAISGDRITELTWRRRRPVKAPVPAGAFVAVPKPAMRDGTCPT